MELYPDPCEYDGTMQIIEIICVHGAISRSVQLCEEPYPGLVNLNVTNMQTCEKYADMGPYPYPCE